MLKVAAYKKGLAIVWIALLVTGCASTGTPQEAKSSADDAEATLASFLKDPEMQWIHQNIKDAKAVLVSPRILKAGFIFGASGGSGVVLARNSAAPHGWNGPAFYHIAAASVGFQAGGEASEIVALIMTEKALNSLLSASFNIGADVSVAAGPVGAGAGAPITADMVVFSKAKGLYGGLNLNGSVVSIDEQGNQSFYGKPATPVDILVKRSVTSPKSASLVRLLSSAGKASGASSSK
jgi:SH3 domain-containing YSC84-like protein 1